MTGHIRPVLGVRSHESERAVCAARTTSILSPSSITHLVHPTEGAVLMYALESVTARTDLECGARESRAGVTRRATHAILA